MNWLQVINIIISLINLVLTIKINRLIKQNIKLQKQNHEKYIQEIISRNQHTYSR